MTDNKKAVDMVFNLAGHLIFEEGHDASVPIVKDCTINHIILNNMIKIGEIDVEKDINTLNAILICGRMEQLTARLSRYQQ